MTIWIGRTLHMAVACLLASASPAMAQPTATSVTEELEPRIVGGRGSTTLGVAGFVGSAFSAEEALPTTYVVHVDAARFLTERFAARVGVIGAGSAGGEDADDLPVGAAALAIHAVGGLQFHFTPRSIASFYLGADYSAQLTQRSEGERGTALGKLGIIGAISSRASVFIEAGYGARLTRGDDGDLVTHVTGQVGVRIKL